MALINAATLRGLAEDFRAIYDQEATKAPTFDIEPLTLTVTGNYKTFDLTYLLNYATIRDWVGDKDVQTIIEGHQYIVTSKKKEATEAVDRYDILADNLGLYRPKIAALGSEATNYPMRLWASTVEANGTCADGLALFSASHKLGKNTNSNLGSTAISTQAIIDTQNAMRAFVGANGLLLNVNPDTIVVPRSLEAKAKQLVGSDWEADTADRDMNRIKDMFNVVYCPYLTDQKSWYMVDSSRGQIKPVVQAILEPLHFIANEAPFAEPVWNRAEFQYSVEGHMNMAPGFPWVIYKNAVS